MSWSAQLTIPSTWRAVNLGDIVSVAYGKALKAEHRSNTGEFSVYSSSGKSSSHNVFLHPGPSLIIGRKGSVGTVFYESEPFWAIDTAYYLDKFNFAVDLEYLKYMLDVVDLKRHSIVVGVPGLNRKDLENQVVLLPPLPEQNRIVEILQRTQALKNGNKKIQERLEELKHSIFISIFGDPLTNPHKYPEKALGDYLKESPQNGLYKHHSFYGSGTPIVRITDFYAGVLNHPQTFSRLNTSDEEKALFRLEQNDVLINRVNSIEYLGKSALIEGLSEPTVFESNIMRLKIDEGSISARYVNEYLNSNYAKQQILRRAKLAVNQASINQQDVQKLKIHIPPSEDISRFESLLLRWKAIVDKFESGGHSRNYESLFQSTLVRAFTGELTASWRETNRDELEVAAAERDAILGSEPRRVVTSASESLPILGENHERRSALFYSLSDKQRALLNLIDLEDNYVTVDSLVDSDENEASAGEIRQTLELLEQTGLIHKVNVPWLANDRKPYLVPAYRSLKRHDEVVEEPLLQPEPVGAASEAS